MVENWRCRRTPANFQICNTRKRPHAVSASAAGNLEDFRESASSNVLFWVSRTAGRPKHHLSICKWHNWCRKCGLLWFRMRPGRDRFWGSGKSSLEQFWFQWVETCTFAALMTLVSAGCGCGGACPHCHLQRDRRWVYVFSWAFESHFVGFFRFLWVLTTWRMLDLSPLYPCV